MQFRRQSCGWLRRVDALPWSLLLTAACLMVLGWIGIGRSEQIASGSGRLLRLQWIWSGIAVLAVGLAVWPRLHVLARWSYLAYLAVTVLLVFVYASPPVHGAQRWLRWGSLGLQPSALFKIVYVLAMARLLSGGSERLRAGRLAAAGAITALPVLLILRQPDLGTALVCVAVCGWLLIVTGVSARALTALTVMGLIATPFVWGQMSQEQRSRVTVLAHQQPLDVPVLEDGYHLHQAKRMIARGGWWGRGVELPVRRQERWWLRVPEGATDSIVAVLAERLGLAGLTLLLGLQLLLIGQMVRIAAVAEDPFGGIVAAGLAGLFAVETVVNTGMMVGLVPMTGLSLPLVSYGGSGLVSHAFGLGLVVNVAWREASV